MRHDSCIIVPRKKSVFNAVNMLSTMEADGCLTRIVALACI